MEDGHVYDYIEIERCSSTLIFSLRVEILLLSYLPNDSAYLGHREIMKLREKGDGSFFCPDHGC